MTGNSGDIVKNLSPERRRLLAERLRESRRTGLAEYSIPKRADSGPAAASFAQSRLWFLDQLQPGQAVYNMPAAVKLVGSLRTAALHQALNSLVVRQASLRTVFQMAAVRPAQIVQSAGLIAFPIIDLSNLQEAERLREVGRLTQEAASLPFNLATGPLVRAALLHTGATEHILVLVLHHIVCDGWSISVLTHELSALHNNLSSGLPSALPELPIQYADFAEWERKRLESRTLSTQLEFWKQRLFGAPPTLELPGKGLAETGAPRGLKRRFWIPEDCAEAVLGLSRSQDATPFMVLLSTFFALLHRYTGRDDILIGTPVAGRKWAETEQLIGCFVNTLVLRAGLEGDPNFIELLKRVKEAALQAYEHDELPFEKLVEELVPERNIDRSPIVQIVFSLHDTPPPIPQLNDLEAELIDLDTATAKFDLTLELVLRSGGIGGSIEFRTDLYDSDAVERMAAHLGVLLDAIVSDPGSPIARLPLLTESERRQAILAWNQTGAKSSTVCVQELFETWAELAPDALAVTSRNGLLTYGQLNRSANRLGSFLRESGAKPDTVVGIRTERGLEMVVGMLGILKAGAGFVPLDPAYPKSRLDFMLEDSGAPLLLSPAGNWESLASQSVQVIPICDGTYEPVGDDIKLPHLAELSDLAYVIYTSGSTGTPKGVGVQHGSLLNLVEWHQRVYQVSRHDRATQLAALSFDACTWEIWPYLAAGASLHIVDDETRSSVSGLIDWLAAEQITICFLPTPLAEAAIESGMSTTALRLLLTGGDRLSKAPSNGLPFGLVNNYGPTETTVVATWHPVQAGHNGDSGTPPIGLPIANTQVYLLDSRLEPAPVGHPAEVHIAGRGLARYYLGRPELTADKFVPAPFGGESGARMYRSGDLARRKPDGNIDYLGRIDSQVKVRGFRIELGEIEAVLGQHPSISASAVTTFETGSGDTGLAAYFVPREAERLTIGEVRRFLAKRLPDYMMPALIALERMPITLNGKIDRAALPRPTSSLVEPAGLSAPSTPVEEIVTGLWTELLGIERLGVRDNFFELGGHSLLATQMLSRLRSIFSLDLPVRIIFERPTVLEIAAYIERERLRAHSPLMRSIQRVSRSAGLPLSFTQERLWFLDQLDPGSDAYNMPAGLRMTGKLNAAALEAVLNEIASRHEVLRTRFASASGQPVQLIDGPQTGVIPLVDLSALVPEEAEEEAGNLAQAEARRPFDLLRGPLIRASLLHVGSDTHILLLTLQHIICDGWSVSVLTREMTELYPVRSTGTPSPLPELQVQYADYACWQRETLNREAIEPLISYWRERLTGLEPIRLYGDRPRPAVQSSNGGDRPLVIPAEAGQSVAALSRRQGATEFMTLLAAFQTLLLHYTGQQDIAVGSSIAGRTMIETEPLIGCFLNTLVLRSDMAGNPSFLQVLGRVRETALGAYANQDAPIEVLLDVLQPERSMSFNPLVQVMFILQNTPKSAMRLGDLDLEFTEFRASAAKFDVTLDLTPTGEGFIGRMEYNADLFDAESIDRMNGHFLNLLGSVVTDPGRPISEASLLSQVERTQLLDDWSVGAQGPHGDVPVHQVFEELADAAPQAIAVVFDSNHLSYGELNSRANQLAWHLRRLGVGPEARVGICLDRSPELITGLFGILKSGGAYVPIDHAYPIGRKESMLRESAARVLVSNQDLADDLAGAVRHFVRLDTDWSEVETNPGSNPDVSVSGQNIAYVIYTSGSTGTPKGTGIEHRSIAAFSETAARRYRIGPSDRVLQFASISFDASAEEIFPCLTSGGTLVLRTPSMIDSVAAFLRFSRNWNLTILDLPTAYWNEVTQELAAGLALPDSVRLVIIGGERALPDTLDMWRRWASSDVERDVELVNSYGPTEATVVAAFCRLSDSARAIGFEVPIGRAIDNVSVYALSPELEPSPIGVPGELHIGGAGIARGYTGNPHITAEKFTPDPHSRQHGSRLYKTGDLARFRRDGYLEFLGRADHQVKVRGYRIELGEVEAALNACPDVKQAVVLAAGAGANVNRLVAYIVPAVRPAPAPGSLRAFVSERLPAYMVPAFFTILDEMPVLPSGKVDRRRLPAAPPVGSGKPGAEPRSPVEEVLAGIYAEVLGVDHVGVEDSFFELGGHSLIATQLVARVRDALGVELPLRSVFESPSVADLAERFEAAAGRRDSSAVPHIAPAPRTGPLPLSFAQERIWFLNQLDPDGTQYHVPRVVRIEGPLNTVLLDHTFTELVRRHEILRTSFPTVAEQPVQVIHGRSEIKLPVVDVTSGGGLEGSTIWPMIIREANRPFDLSSGPMLRVRLLRLGEREHILLMVEHHLVHDGWTQGVFVRDFLETYDAFSRGDRAPRPDLAIQYADFAYWQRQWLRGEALEKQIAYWKLRLAGIPPVLELPTDRPRPSVQSFRGDQVILALDADLAESLRALARRNNATLYMAMLSSFNLLLSRWSGREDIIVGSGIANRRWREIEGMLGMIINTIVLRTNISGCRIFRDLLAVQREVCLEAYAHQDAPFEKVVEALQPVRSLSYNPLFQVDFAFMDTPLPELELPGLSLNSIDAHNRSAKFDLNLTVLTRVEQLIGQVTAAVTREILVLWEYTTDLFDRPTMDRMTRHYLRMLRSIAADPDQSLANVEMLDPAERHQLLAGWNDTVTEYRSGAGVHQIFEEVAARRPEAVGIDFDSGQLTYGELNRRADRLARHLMASGLRPNSVAGILLERSVEMLTGYLAILKAGAAYLPLDPEYPDERLRFMLSDSGARLLVSRRALLQNRQIDASPASDGSGSATLRRVYLDVDSDVEEHRSIDNSLQQAMGGSHAAYVMYTSGTTGRPKGIEITHRGILRLVTNVSYVALTPADIFLQFAPVSFDASTFEIWGCLLNGGRLVLCATLQSLEGLGATLERHRVTTLWLTAGLFHQMVEEQLESLSSVRQLLAGGDVLSAPHARRFAEEGFGATLVNGYGPTENTTFTCCCPITVHAQFGASVPIGRPIANTQVYVLDPGLELAPIGVRGQLFIGGDGLASGYVNAAGATAECFVPNPLSDSVGDRMYQSGDLAAHRPDGNLEFHGRMDHQVKVRGYRIETAEIESVLKEHPAVHEAVVVAHAEPLGGKRLIGYVVAERGLGPAELRSWLRARFPEYVIPAALVTLPRLPLTENGKVDRRALPDPDIGARPGAGESGAPWNPVEEALAEIWKELLGAERVGLDDNFFELGGHSLVATRVVSRIRSLFHAELSMGKLFERPTIRELARDVSSAAGTGVEIRPIKPLARAARSPLSYAQERVWFLELTEPESAAYNIGFGIKLHGALSSAALGQSLAEIARRHQILRTLIHSGETPEQVFADTYLPEIQAVDLTELSSDQRNRVTMRLGAETRRRRFDLGHVGLLRMALVSESDNEASAIGAIHHIIFDGWSMAVLMREMGVLYQAYCDGRQSSLHDLTFQYADYAAWQRHWLKGPVLDSLVDYFVDRLAGARPLELPSDRIRSRGVAKSGAIEKFAIASPLLTAVKAANPKLRTTLFINLLSAFTVLLHKYTGEVDFNIGTPIAGRGAIETEGLIGLFVNTLVIRSAVTAGQSYSSLLEQVKLEALGAYAHQDAPFEKVVERLAPERDTARPPLLQVMMVLQNAPFQTLELKGVTTDWIDTGAGVPKFDLTLSIAEAERGLMCEAEYRSDLFDATTVRRWLTHFERVLRAVSADPDRLIRDIGLLSEAERSQTLIEWNATAADYVSEPRIHEIVRAQTAERPESVAVVFRDHHSTYAELNRQSDRLARYLRSQGVGPDLVVGICLERGIEMLTGLLGILKTGAAYLPLDPEYPAERLRIMAEDAACAAVVTVERLQRDLPEFNGSLIALKLQPGQQTSPHAEGNLDGYGCPDNLAYVIYTSGSTGMPKGVMISHRAICNRLLWMQAEFPLGAGDILLQKTTYSFDASVWELYLPLMAGARVVMAEPGGQADPDYLIKTTREQGVTVLQLVPSMLRVLLDEPDFSACQSLRRVFCGGERLGREVVNEFHALMNCGLTNLYGPTEASIDASSWKCGEADEFGTIPIGRPLANMKVLICDSELGPEPIGSAGELFIAGVGLARGYHGRPDLTSERFLPNPLGLAGERFYRTGDVARHRSDGNIEYLGRADTQVKIRGYRIEPAEVEAALMKDAYVREAAVVASNGQAKQAGLLIAYVVREKAFLEETDGMVWRAEQILRNRLKASLPGHLIPGAFVMVDSLPRTRSGKLDRAALSSLFVAGQELVDSDIPPRNQIEEILASIWAEMLGIDRAGIEQDFFQAGGHSLLGARLMARVRNTFRIDLPLRLLFDSPTVAAMADAVERALNSARLSEHVPIRRASRQARPPLSFAQERLWFLHQMDSASAFYNCPCAVKLFGPLNTATLEQTVNRIISRHEAFRTTFGSSEGRPFQAIAPHLSVAVQTADLSGTSEQVRSSMAERLLDLEAKRPFDLSIGPLVRVVLLRLGELEHALHFNMHHIVSDAWSLNILTHELGVEFGALAVGGRPPLKDLPFQYVDYAIWQRETLQGQVLDGELAYWRNRLASLTPLDLPLDYSRPKRSSHRGGRRLSVVSPELAAAIKSLSRREAATEFMTWLAAFQVLLHLYTGQEDVVVGTDVANRDNAETQVLIGFFVNQLVLRADFSQALTFIQHLKHVRADVLGALSHQDLPFEKLVEELQPERDASRAPLFQVKFSAQKFARRAPALPGLFEALLPVDTGTAKVDLTVMLSEGAPGLVISFEYSTDLFTEPTIARMAGHFETLLRNIVHDPARQVTGYSLLGEAERHQAVMEWNGWEEAQGEEAARIEMMVVRQARIRPDAVAVASEGEQITYRKLDDRANQIGRYLRRRGVRPEVLVGVVMERGMEMVVGLLGILKAGGGYVPIDTGYPPQRVEYILADAAIGVVVTLSGLRQVVEGRDVEILCLDAEEGAIRMEGEGAVDAAGLGGNAAYVMYTSGSTGKPKGVVVSHWNVVRLLRSTEKWFGFNEEDVWTVFHSCGFDLSVWEMWGALGYGGRAVMVPYWVSRAPEAFDELLRREQVTVLTQTPQAFVELVKEDERRGGERSERVVIFGGEAFDEEGLRPWFERHREERARLVNMYGITETTVWVTYSVVAGGESRGGGGSTIGRGIEDLQGYVLGCAGEVAPIGGRGEIFVGGAGLARGYLNRGELSAERFVPDGISGVAGGRLYRSGDEARCLPDGNLEFLGRLDHQVKIRGHRIEIGEIEAALKEQPGIEGAVVLARDDGSGGKRLVGYVVGEVVDTRNLRSNLKQFLPDHMVPAAFVKLDGLPLTVNGKIDRKALPDPEPAAGDEDSGRPPRTPVEEIIAGIWADVLQIPRVQIDDSFFDLGGHSLLAIRVISKVRETLNFNLGVESFFEAQTLAELAALVDRGLAADHEIIPPPVTASAEQAKIPLSFAQHRLWFLDRLEPMTATYNIPSAFFVRGRFGLHVLESSLSEVVRRHEVLGIRIEDERGAASQVRCPLERIQLRLVDLSRVDGEETDLLAGRLAREEAATAFDLAAGPLLRATMLRLRPQDHLILFTMHHIMSDGWSMRLLDEEIGRLYSAFQNGIRSPLDELKFQYRDYTIWQRQWLTGSVLDSEIAYWKEKLAGVEVLEMPSDRPRTAARSKAGASQKSLLPVSLVGSLRDLARREGATFFMSLLAAFKVLIYRYTGQEDIAVGTPIAGRTRSEFEPLIGLFLNSLVIRNRAASDLKFTELLASVRRESLEAYAHQHVPFEKVVDELRPARDPIHTPLFQVMLVLQIAPNHGIDLAGLDVAPIATDTGTAKFDLTLVVTESNDGALCTMEYPTALYDAQTIHRILGHFETLLAGICDNPSTEVGKLSLLSATERHQAVMEWNGWETGEVNDSARIEGMIGRQARVRPDAIAVVDEGEQITYGGLDERANQLARYLRSRGVGPEELVGVVLERGVEMVVGLLGILKAGGGYVPIDPGYPRQRVEYMLADARIAVVVTAAPHRELVEARGVELVCVDADGAAIGKESNGAVERWGSSGNAAYVIYTSGSTGKPKGVVVSHWNVVRLLQSTERWFAFNELDVWTVFHSYAFDFSVWEIWGALAYGGRAVLVPYWVSRAPEALDELLRREQVTVLNQTPQAFFELMKEDETRGGLRTERLVIFGGEALDHDRLNPWINRHGTTPRLVNMYGITETTVHVTYSPVRGQARQTAGGSLIGRGIGDLQVYIVGRPGDVAPIGARGEICIGGAGLARGYLNRAELTAERFAPDGISSAPGTRLYRSGDEARYVSDGTLEYVGRLDRQVKIRGHRIEIGEIEATLIQQPGIEGAVVLLRDDAAGQKRLIAYVAGGEALQTGEIRARLKEKLPDYMVPGALVKLRKFPMTPNGKVDRNALPAPAYRPEVDRPYEPPRTPAEEVLVAIWSAVLGIEEIGIHDNFFELGGDSIYSIRVLALARERGLGITLPQLFEHQTIHELARVAGAADPAARISHTSPFSLISAGQRENFPDSIEDAYPLATLQAGMLWHIELTSDSPLYHNVNSIHLKGRLDIDVFHRAVADVVARHPVLRTSFDLGSSSEPLQLVHKQAVLPVVYEDISGLTYAEQEAAVDALIEREARRRFDLSRPALIRFHIQQRTPESFQFTLTECHAIIDGWSLHATLTEIFDRHFSILENDDLPQEPPFQASYRDFIAAERAAVDSKESQDYWSRVLEGCTVLDLPKWPGRSAASAPGPQIHKATVPIDGDLSDRLKHVARLAVAPIKSVLLAAHIKVMSIISGQSDILTGLTCNGRLEGLDGESVRGLFLNVLPVRFRLSEGSWLDMVREVFRAELDLLPHRRYPFGVLQNRWGRQPLVETQFNFTHFRVVDALLRSGKLEVLGLKKSEKSNLKLVAHANLNVVTGNVELYLEYDSTWLADEKMNVISSYFARVMNAMAGDPDSSYQSINLLSDFEEHQILSEWNDTGIDREFHGWIHELIGRRGDTAPDAVAVKSGGAGISFRQLNRRANQVANCLRVKGVGPDSIVGILMERGIEMAVGLLGILKAGAAYLPLDPDHPSQRLHYMLADASAGIVVTVQGLRAIVHGAGVEMLCLDSDCEEIERQGDSTPAGGVAGDDLAYVLYTSGSTGKPKGVMCTHEGILDRLHWIQRTAGLDCGDVVLQRTPYSFDISLTELFWPLINGAALVMAKPGGHQDSRYLADVIAEERVTTVQFVPSMLELFLGEDLLYECEGLKCVLCIGEALSENLETRFFAAMSADLYNLYGPTEAAVEVTYWKCDGAGNRGRVPIGRPIANARTHILGEQLQPLVTGVPGELHLGGLGLARGYVGRTDLTAERFIPDPFSARPGERLYKTGDVSQHLADGNIDFLGRLDHQVKIHGNRIETGEVEAVLREQPGVRDALVMARESSRGENELVAYVVGGQDSALFPGAVREMLGYRLPAYMIPSSIVILDSLPLTANGKIDRKSLAASRLPERVPSPVFVPPRTELESTIAAVWREVLELDEVGVTDNFFDIGGQSVLMLQVYGKLQKQLKKDLVITDFFRLPTISSLTEHLNADESQTPSFEEKYESAETKREGMRRRKRRRKDR